PFAADPRWLVTRDVAGTTVTVGLHDAGTGSARWTARYELDPAAATPGEGPPPGRQPAPDRPPAGPGGPGGGPPEDAAWRRSEGRLTGTHVSLRDARQLTVLRLADGGTAWQRTLPRPVTDI